MLPDLRTAGSIRDISEMIARFLSGTLFGIVDRRLFGIVDRRLFGIVDRRLFGIVDRRLFGVVTVVSGALVGHVRTN